MFEQGLGCAGGQCAFGRCVFYQTGEKGSQGDGRRDASGGVFGGGRTLCDAAQHQQTGRGSCPCEAVGGCVETVFMGGRNLPS